MPIDDHFWSSTSVAEGALLAGQHGIYLMPPTGAIDKLVEFNTARIVRILKIGERTHIFAAESGIFEWKDRVLVDVSSDYAWAKNVEIGSIQNLQSGALLVTSSKGFYHVQNKVARKIFDPIWKANQKYAIQSLYIYGDRLVLSTFHDGIRVYNLSDAQELWHISPSNIGGNIYSTLALQEGLVLGTSVGISVLPDPSRYVTYQLPEGDLRFAAQTSRGPMLGLTTGTYLMPLGQPIQDNSAFSIAELPSGKTVFGGLGEVRFESKTVHLGGRDVLTLAAINEHTVVALQPSGATIVSDSGTIAKLPHIETTTSVGVTSRGHVLIGTEDGAYVHTSDGARIQKIGKGTTRVFQCSQGVFVVDTTGVLYRENGEAQLTLPSADVLSITDWNGQLCALLRLSGDQLWVGVIDAAMQTWSPYDIPVPPNAEILLTRNTALTIVAPRQLLEVHSANRLSSPSEQGVAIMLTAGGHAPRDIRLRYNEESLGLLLPGPRIYPWRNPRFTVQLNENEPYHPCATSTFDIPRLPVGTNHIRITAEWANLSSHFEIDAHRDYPWWISPMGIGFYSITVLTIGSAAVYWRTRHLERRARKLQQAVDAGIAQIRSAHKAREEFFSTLSHEIRNPLNGVVGLCEVLDREENLQDRQRLKTLVRTLKGCSDQLRSIIDDVLDFTRIDRGEISLHAQSFEIMAAVEGAVRAVDAELARSTIQGPTAPSWVRGDEGKVRQIVTNLVSNALKYGVPKQAHVQISAEAKEGAKVQLSISVVNTGPAIPPEELEMIFSGFVRGSDATKRRIAGTGLGLAVSRRIAQAMGGTLHATSSEGMTEFNLSLELPIAQPATEEKAVTEKPLQTRRVLAIEDEPYNRLVLEHQLKDLGFEADWAVDGSSAMEKVRSAKYDLILTDLALPDISGFELARRIRAESKSPAPPIIAVTAFCTPEKIDQAHAAGIVAVVTKPVSEERLAQVLQQQRHLDTPSKN